MGAESPSALVRAWLHQCVVGTAGRELLDGLQSSSIMAVPWRWGATRRGNLLAPLLAEIHKELSAGVRVVVVRVEAAESPVAVIGAGAV